MMAFFFVAVSWLLVSVAMPFKKAGDDLFAKACAFALTGVFVSDCRSNLTAVDLQ